MPDAVVDTSFLAMANDTLTEVGPGSPLARRVQAISRIAERVDRLRCNPKLLSEYEPHIRTHRNDVIDQFVALLDDPTTVMQKSSTLRTPDKVKANKCRWPTHDQHVLAAAIGGDEVVIHVTENTLGGCQKLVRRIFGFHVNHIPQ